MMFGVALIICFSCAVVDPVASHSIKVTCHETHDLPPCNDISPSKLADLKVDLVTDLQGQNMLNISWAISIDASIKSLTGTRILIDLPYLCEYDPPLAEAHHSGSKQEWFYNLVSVDYGRYHVQACNVPLPPLGSGLSNKDIVIEVPKPPIITAIPTTTMVPTGLGFVSEDLEEDVPDNVNYTGITAAILGGLACLIILSSCYLIYKRVGASFATSLGFKRLPVSTVAPVPVLLVYPAEDLSFQRAVVALAEFLQWHGGCSVAVDMWQQGKIAKLGPMRWLAEQAKAAARVLVVCAQSSSQPGHPPLSQSFPELSIPAAAHDLYPLVLNMVASNAKNASDLAKFWVVQLGQQRDKRPCDRAPELRTCKTFCLTKDLNKLWRSLYNQRHGNKKMIFRMAAAYDEKSTVKLREAVEKLEGHQSGVFKEAEPMKSVVSTV